MTVSKHWLFCIGVALVAASCSSDDSSAPRMLASGQAGAGVPDAAVASSPSVAPGVTPPPVPPASVTPSNVDADGDGFTQVTGDCEERSALVNPGAYDFPGNGQDEDCSGSDATAMDDLCDGSAAIDSKDATDGARAIGLCRFVTEASKQWGVISARYVRAAGDEAPHSPLQTGILPSLGVTLPRQGKSMLALSSGVARAPDQKGYTSDCDPIASEPDEAPQGFPKASPACPDAMFGEVFDPVALELKLRIPTNAKSFGFDSNFYTYEYPDFICKDYNDVFVALVDPKPASLPDGNILFDQDGNVVSVNNSLLQVCSPGEYGGKNFPCPQGNSQLQGSGFSAEAACASNLANDFPGAFPGLRPPANNGEPAAATGWLHTTAPVAAGSVITLRFAIWDSADGILDSLGLVDNFAWSVDVPVIETKPVVPQ